MQRPPRARTLPTLGLMLLLPLSGHAQWAIPPADVSVLALSAEGPYLVRSYQDFPEAPEFGAATIYFPAATLAPVGGVAIAPGFTEMQRHVEWWGPRLASHGYAVLVLDTNDPRDPPPLRAEALMAGVRTLRAENVREESPLFGRIDGDRMAVMGHSMGGGGALLAGATHPEELRAVVGFTPWQPNARLDDLTVPTLIIAGSADRIAAVEEHAWPHFLAIPDATPRIYLEVDDGDHFISDTTRGNDLDRLGRYTIAWLMLHMDGDERLAPLLRQAWPEADRTRFSRYLVEPADGN